MAYIIEVELIQNPPPTTFDTPAVKIGKGTRDRIGKTEARLEQRKMHRPLIEVCYQMTSIRHRTESEKAERWVEAAAWEPGKGERESDGVRTIQYSRLIQKLHLTQPQLEYATLAVTNKARKKGIVSREIE